MAVFMNIWLMVAVFFPSPHAFDVSCWTRVETTCCAHAIANQHLCIACDPGGTCCPYVFDQNDSYYELAHPVAHGWDSD